jgi:diguanylate cyclase (GGDEF)-like protein
VAGEESLLTRDGERRHFWSTKIPLRIDGVVSASVGTYSDITEVIQLRERFEQLANTDALTGISSRRHWLAGAEAELKRMRRAGHSLALALFDVDAFKGVNDRHGHAVGDRALIAVVEACRSNLREIDGFGRLGGDEFVLCLPQVDEAGALRVVERLREAIAASQVDAAGTPVPISCSFGLVLSAAEQSLEELLTQADAALYQAKLAGRNCVRVAG